MTNQFAFNSRPSYFIARMDWRAAYKAISHASRVARKGFVEAQRAFSADPSTKNSSAVSSARAERSKIRHEAKNLLAARAAMKVEAARQWQVASVSSETHANVTL